MTVNNGWHRPTAYIGKSTDPKPTEVGWVDKLWLVEADTGDVYLFDGANWVFQYHIGGGGGGTPSDTVADEVFGQTAVPGVDTKYSRGDHKHAMPANPVPYSHSHPESEVTDLISDLTAIITELGNKSDIGHGHAESEVTNLVTDLAGKEAANANIQTHVTSAHAPANAQKNSDITKAEIEAKLTGEIVSHTHPGGGGELEVVVVKVGDTANATTTLADAAGLSFTALANKTYIIEALIRYATSVTTVGIQLSANGPASPAFIAGLWDVNAAQGTPDGGAFNAYDVKIAAGAAPFLTDNLARLHCLFRNGATQGAFIIRFCAETTGTITIKDGSVLRYRQVD